MIRFLLGALHLVLVLWCLYDLLKSKRTLEQKILWAIVILIFPLAGPVIYFLISRKIIQM
ncbi:MAG: PLD nuclease N-terminal domain-containing protein [Cyclobacteriaceae bacterium]|nr:PLD nuclease N-terminal domain-containing protein [Cyclobacteriaceae bacterium]